MALIQETKELTNEQILIKRLIEECREDLQKLDLSKKARIQRLAEDLDSTGVIPTNMICDLIATKLKDCFTNRGTITDALDAKYKNQNLARPQKNNNNTTITTAPPNTGPESQSSSSSVYDYDYNLTDYGACFDVRDCNIEEWNKYSDSIKRKWVITLIDDKRELQRQVIELEQRVASLLFVNERKEAIKQN